MTDPYASSRDQPTAQDLSYSHELPEKYFIYHMFHQKVDLRFLISNFLPDLRKSRFELSILDDDSIRAVALTCANIVSDS